MIFTAFPGWRSAHKDRVENKPASLLVVSLGKTLNGMLFHLHVADRWWGQAVYLSWWLSLTKDMQTEHKLIRLKHKIRMRCKDIVGIKVIALFMLLLFMLKTRMTSP